MTTWKKGRSITLLALAGMLFVMPVAAQDSAEQSRHEAERAEHAKEAEAQRSRHEAERAKHAKEAEAHMREAELQMEEAARRIAELSSEQLARAGRFERKFIFGSGRPMLGITIDSDSQREPVEGVTVMGISPSGAADEAGLRSGDIITAVNGESLSSESAHDANKKLLDFMQGVEEGDVIDVDYLRDGKNGAIELAPRESNEHVFDFDIGNGNMRIPGIPDLPAAQFYSWSGQFSRHGFGDMEMVELNESLGRYFGTDSGLLVIKAPSENAYQLQDGDVIKNIDGRTPNDLRHAIRILSSYQAGETVNIEIMRDKRKKKIAVEVPDNRRSFIAPVAPASPAAAIIIKPNVKVVRKVMEQT